jgi:hypothetical protein
MVVMGGHGLGMDWIFLAQDRNHDRHNVFVVVVVVVVVVASHSAVLLIS